MTQGPLSWRAALPSDARMSHIQGSKGHHSHRPREGRRVEAHAASTGGPPRCQRCQLRTEGRKVWRVRKPPAGEELQARTASVCAKKDASKSLKPEDFVSLFWKDAQAFETRQTRRLRAIDRACDKGRGVSRTNFSLPLARCARRFSAGPESISLCRPKNRPRCWDQSAQPLPPQELKLKAVARRGVVA